MLPSNCEYHSLDQLALIQRLSAEARLTARDALFLATQLVVHGFPHAGALVDRLKAGMTAKSALDYLDHLARRHAAIQSLPLLKQVQADGEGARRLLDPRGYVFRPGSFRRETAVVIFTTKFNNFGFSNIVADALFAQLGVSRLYLKDGSEFVYFNGVEGLAERLDGLPAAIARLLAPHGVRQTIVTGFSSGGYASLHAATGQGLLGYVGYAICTDLSASTSLPVPKFYAKLQGRVAQELFTDLKARVAERPGTTFKLFFGERDSIDRQHGEHLIGCPNAELTCRADAGHDIAVQMLEDRRFLEPFEELLQKG